MLDLRSDGGCYTGKGTGHPLASVLILRSRGQPETAPVAGTGAGEECQDPDRVL